MEIVIGERIEGKINRQISGILFRHEGVEQTPDKRALLPKSWDYFIDLAELEPL